MEFVDQLSLKLLPLVSKMNNQRHLVSIRDGFIVTMPLVLAASIMLLLNALVFSNTFVQKFIDLSFLSNSALIINNGTMAILAILVCYHIGFNLANYYITSGIIKDKTWSANHAGVLSIAVMFIVLPLQNKVPLENGQTSLVSGVFSQEFTGSSGLVIGMICALLATELFVKLSKTPKLKIKMPEGVPPAIATSFGSLLPEIIVVFLFGTFAFILQTYFHLDFPTLIVKIIQSPLKFLVLSVPGMLFLQFFSDFLWVFGMHGNSIIAPIRYAPLLQSISQNIEAFAAGHKIPNIITDPFTNAFGLIGGGGCILPLIITILWLSKRKDQHKIAKLGLTPCLFNITEPIMFGMPVVMNPIYMIPCALIPSINISIAYLLTSFGLIDRTVAAVPWITPPILQSFLATGGDIKAAIVTVLLIILDVFLFAPFVLAANKAKEETG